MCVCGRTDGLKRAGTPFAPCGNSHGAKIGVKKGTDSKSVLELAAMPFFSGRLAQYQENAEN